MRGEFSRIGELREHSRGASRNFLKCLLVVLAACFAGHFQFVTVMLTIVQARMVLDDVRIFRIRCRSDNRSAEIPAIRPLFGQNLDMSSRHQIFVCILHINSLRR